VRVIIFEDALNAPGIETWQLHELLIFACSGRHVVSFDSPATRNRCLQTFDPQARADYERVMGLNARAAGTLPADVATVHVRATASPHWEDPVAVLPVADALALLRERLGILVENAANDWSFLLGIMRASDRDRLRRAVDQDWAVALHGGGGTLNAQLRARLAVPKQSLRTFVMFDSDRRHPDELNPAWTPSYPETCDAVEIEALTRAQMPHRYWMLQRRSIESYMPEPELRGEASRIANRDTSDAFYRMTRDERWYFNMKKGFAGDEPAENNHRRRNLYASINASDHAALYKGFGRQLAEHYAHATAREFDWDAEARREAAAVIPRLMRLL
jgi:hypothetical protein